MNKCPGSFHWKCPVPPGGVLLEHTGFLLDKLNRKMPEVHTCCCPVSKGCPAQQTRGKLVCRKPS